MGQNMIRKEATKWEVSVSGGKDPWTDKLRVVRPRGGSRIFLEIDAPGVRLALIGNELIARQKIQEAVDDLREALKSRLPLPLPHEDKITLASQGVGRRILLEIDASKIRSVERAQRAIVRRKIRAALDALQAALDSPTALPLRQWTKE